MARKGLPKKYAKMGFKKGWAAYKRSKNKGTRKRRNNPKKKTTRRRRASKPQGRKRMGRRRGISLNKKSALLFGISLWQMKVLDEGIMVLKGDKPFTTAAENVMNRVRANPTIIAPAAIGYWFWGKPYRGRL